MPPRDRSTMRRAEDGERLARLEEQGIAIRATLVDIQKGMEYHYDEIREAIKELRESKAREHETIHTRINALEVEQSGQAGKIAGAAAAASVGTGLVGWLAGWFGKGH